MLYYVYVISFSSNLQDRQRKFDITEKDGDLIDNGNYKIQ